MWRKLLIWCILGAMPLGLAAQELGIKEARIVFGKQRILKFRNYTLELTDESKAELRELANLIRLTPGLVKTNLLIIQTFTCEMESKVKPYLGVCRGQVVVDYLAKAVGMPRKKCLIQDSGPNPYDKECIAGSGANLYLQPDWRGR